MSAKQYDIVILGGGTGGYIAAIRAAQLGKSVAIVERDKLGGTCLHRGCIPSKALLRSAEVYATLKKGEDFGIEASDVGFNLSKAQQRKAKVVEQLHTGVQFLMKKNKIDIYYGNGRIIGPSIFSPKSGTIAVERTDGEIENIVPVNLIIATGSKPRELPGLASDGEYILTSDHALQMDELPESMLIVGGGVIGIEWASMLSDFGVQVTVVEYADRILPTEDRDISKEMERVLKKRGVKVLTGAKILPETYRTESGMLKIDAERKGEQTTLSASKMLVSVGREGVVNGIGLENTDIKVEKGFIKVNARLQTTESHIYAIGDVIGGMQLAHAAGHEGIAAVEHICGQSPHMTEDHLIPRCIYSRPEAASIGWTEEAAIQRGYEVKKGSFPFKGIGKAVVYGETDGFVKVIADAKSGDILGVHMIGPHVTDMISEAALAQVLDAVPWEVGQTIHPHPTLSEALGEAMLALEGKAIGI